jgi:hypothetical protein
VLLSEREWRSTRAACASVGGVCVCVCVCVCV